MMDGSIVIGVGLDTSAFEAALGRLRQSAGQSAIQALQPLIQGLGSLTSAFGRSTSAGSSWSGTMTGLFQQVQNSAAAVIPSLTQTGTTAAAAFLSGFRQADGAGAGRILAQRVVTGIASGSYQNAGYQAAVSVASGLGSGKGTVFNAASGLSAKIRDAFSGGWYNVGYNISDGIASGVRGGSSLITAAALQAARDALAAAKRALGVRSPSRVFRDQVGRMIPAGIALGIRGGTPEVEQAIRRQSERVVATARRDVIPTTTILQSGEKTPVVSGSSQVRLLVESPLYVDGREIARATAKYTEQQILWEAM